MQLKSLLAVALLIAGLDVSRCAFGGQATPPNHEEVTPNSSMTDASARWPSPDEVVAKMSGKLNLSDDQKSKITPIVADRQEKMRELMSDPSGRRLRKARKAKSIISESDKKIEAILTGDQKKIYEQMKEERREQMQSRMQ